MNGQIVLPHTPKGYITDIFYWTEAVKKTQKEAICSDLSKNKNKMSAWDKAIGIIPLSLNKVNVINPYQLLDIRHVMKYGCFNSFNRNDINYMIAQYNNVLPKNIPGEIEISQPAASRVLSKLKYHFKTDNPEIMLKTVFFKNHRHFSAEKNEYMFPNLAKANFIF